MKLPTSLAAPAAATGIAGVACFQARLRSPHHGVRPPGAVRTLTFPRSCELAVLSRPSCSPWRRSSCSPAPVTGDPHGRGASSDGARGRWSHCSP